MDWNFRDPENLAVITTKKIIARQDWVAHVFHDEDDGGWQFLGAGDFAVEDASVVGLCEMWRLDQSIGDLLINLPLGYRASRRSAISPWIIEKVIDF